MFSSKTTPSGHSSGNLFAPKPFGVATNFVSPFGMSNSSGTTSGMVGETSSSPFPSTTIFGAPSTTAFGVSTSGFGFTSAPALGFSSSGFSGSSAFGQKLAFGTSSTTGVGFSSTPTFGLAAKSSLGNPSSFSGSQVATPTFGSQNRGSRVATYTRTWGVDHTAEQPEKMVSISAMPVYKDKSHEELRSEDYQFNSPSASVTPSNASTSIPFSNCLAHLSASTSVLQPTPVSGPNSFSPCSHPSSSSGFATPLFNGSSNPAISGNPFSTRNLSSSPDLSSSLFTDSRNAPTSRNPFSSITPPTASSLPVFSSSSFTNFLTNSSCTPSTSVTLPASPFGPASSFSSFQPSTSPALSVNVSSATSVIPLPTTPFGPKSSFSFFQPSSSPALSVNPISSATSVIPLPASPFSPASSFSLFQPSSSPALSVNPVSSATSVIPFPLYTPPIGGSFFANSPSTTSLYAPSTTVTEAGGQNNITQGFESQTTADGQPSSGANPFGSLPPIPKMSIGGPGSSATVQYGISSLSVQNKPAPVRVSSLPSIRHLSRRNRLPVQKYDPKVYGPKVPFFTDDREIPDSQFVPRENPRALVIRPTEHWPLRANSGKLSVLGEKLTSTHLYDDSENGTGNVDIHSDELNMEQTDDSAKERDSPVKVPEVEALLPKLQLSGYYTEPRIQELAAKERADPGFCSHVKNFVVGRHGYGSIKFVGKTDVRRLDLESYVEFNNREVIVYKDESKKPPVGQGLNKPAEVTLLNINFFDKKSGNQCIDGPKLDKYREMLMKKAAEQGAEFVSYDPVGGEWKFRVQHF